MQINHNIRAMITQHSLYTNNNAMSKSLEKLSTGLRVNRAQDDAAGLAMSEQMRSQIRGLGKAKQNAQDGIAALQIAEGAMAEITNMLQRQKELAVQAANDTLTSTERMYLNDEFQQLTKEIDRIAKTTDYNGKNVLVFDKDENLSFGATKLNPYNREVSFMDSSRVLYDAYGAKLTGGLNLVGGEGITNSDIEKAKSELKVAENAKSIVQNDIDTILKAINALRDSAIDGQFDLTATLGGSVKTSVKAILSSFDLMTYTPNGIDPTDASSYAKLIEPKHSLSSLAGVQTAINTATNTVQDVIDELSDLLDKSSGLYGSQLQSIQNTIVTKNKALDDAKVDINKVLGELNKAITNVNGVVSSMNGIPLSEGNIKEVLSKILSVGDVAISVSGTGATATYATIKGADIGVTYATFGGDKVYSDVREIFNTDDKNMAITDDLLFSVTGSDAQAIKDFNQFLRDVRDTYEAYKVTEIADPRYGDDSNIQKASINAMRDTLDRLFGSDNRATATNNGGIIKDAPSTQTYTQINTVGINTGNYNMLAEAANNIIGQLNELAKDGGYTLITVNGISGVLNSGGVSTLGSIFGSTASPQMKDAVNTLLSFDASKMSGNDGELLAWNSVDKQIVLALQKAVSELSESYNNYATERSNPVGTAASEILHITPNYSRSLGGREASEIMVNYVEINTKNLGMESQSITEQRSATRAIDQIDEVIKVVSGNRAAIGTYINRLEYTVNNIASMTYNTQEAESRIRDTDFSKETTEFTKNQIMVQSATSILAQANSLPQSVLALIG